MQALPWIGTVLCVATLSAAEKQPEERDVAALLRHEIVGRVLPLAEIQRFCERRVPRLGCYRSAAEWEAAVVRLRQQVLDGVVFRRQAAAWRDAETGRVAGDHPGRARLSHQEAPLRSLPGYWIPALLYEPGERAGKVPVVMNVNGHVRPAGKAVPTSRSAASIRPSAACLALNVEWLGMGH